MSYVIFCDRCSRKFGNCRSLNKHRRERHGRGVVKEPYFVDKDGKKPSYDMPKATKLPKREMARYRRWLACVAERFRSAHHPKSRGGWFRIDINQAPKEYFSHILCVTEIPLFSVKMSRHLRPPVISSDTLRFSYKAFNIDVLKGMLAQQKHCEFQAKRSFINDVDVSDSVGANIEDPRAALEAAKNMAGGFQRIMPTARSLVEIGEGEGRATREFEIQWWPNLYKCDFGKLTFRFYVNKIFLV